MMKFNVIDLFAGCGGFSLGFEKAGFNITKAVEFDPKIANVYIRNHKNTKIFVDDIGKVNNSQNFKINECDVIIGGPPCQGFSMAGARIRQSFVDDPRNYLFKQYFKVVQIVKPRYFIIENVKGILTMNDGEIFKEILRIFADSSNFNGDKYFLHYKVVKATDFGIPQSRERVVIIGSKNKDFDFEEILNLGIKKVIKTYPKYFDKVTVWDAIGNLPTATDDGIIKNPVPITEYQKFLKSDYETITNHSNQKHSIKTIERIKKIKQGENYETLDEQINSVHSGSYGRLMADGVCPTITTRFDTPSAGCYIHPIYNRTLTPREAARIQSFPDDFEFIGGKMIICKTIGNAVPPKISYVFGVALMEALKYEIK